MIHVPLEKVYSLIDKQAMYFIVLCIHVIGVLDLRTVTQIILFKKISIPAPDIEGV